MAKPLIKKLVHNFIRSHVAAGLATKVNLPYERAEEMTEAITEADIDKKLAEKKIGAFGSGGLLQWIDSHRTEIASIIAAFIAALSLFGDEKPKQ